MARELTEIPRKKKNIKIARVKRTTKDATETKLGREEGMKMAIIKHRHIKFTEAPSEDISKLEELVGRVKGVRKVSVSMERMEVYVEYDLSECCEEAIEHWMEKNGFRLYDGFLERIKRGWIHYTEENERDALQAEPHSCCNVEKLEGKKKQQR